MPREGRCWRCVQRYGQCSVVQLSGARRRIGAVETSYGEQWRQQQPLLYVRGGLGCQGNLLGKEQLRAAGLRRKDDEEEEGQEAAGVARKGTGQEQRKEPEPEWKWKPECQWQQPKWKW